MCPLHNKSATVSWAYANIDADLYHQLFCDVCTQQRTFVELGAGNGGRVGSNTLNLEMLLKFRGLLIEGHPDNARTLIRARGGGRSRGNVIIPEAVCKRAGAVTYAGDGNLGTAGIIVDI